MVAGSVGNRAGNMMTSAVDSQGISFGLTLGNMESGKSIDIRANNVAGCAVGNRACNMVAGGVCDRAGNMVASGVGGRAGNMVTSAVDSQGISFGLTLGNMESGKSIGIRANN